jgi:hypothetical protein
MDFQNDGRGAFGHFNGLRCRTPNRYPEREEHAVPDVLDNG